MLVETLSDKRSLYISPRHDVATEVLVPAFKTSTSVDIMMGYFSSNSFKEIADGLATFLNATSGKIRLVISPFLTTEDNSISSMSEEELRDFVQNTIFNVEEGADHIVDYCLACFGWMLSEKRLEIKIATLDEGIFHTKVWLFNDGQNVCALHGSMNQTKRGIKRNVENLTLSRPWVSEERLSEVLELTEFFNEVFDNNDPTITVTPLADAIKQQLVEKYCENKTLRPNGEVSEKFNSKQENTATAAKQILIPEHLVYDKGDFKHQGDALDAWTSANMSGVLHMATGAGKTITSLICAHKFQQFTDGALIFIAAPQAPLLLQWVDEVSDFGVTAVNLSDLKNWNARSKSIKTSVRNLKFNLSKAEIFVLSNTLLKTEDFQSIITNIDVPKLLIADECHNLGENFLPIEFKDLFAGKLGLSATPKRQYDEKGTDYLEKFFGPICYSFTLDDAIGKCLTPYDYFVHEVYFDHLEMEEFVHLTKKIGALSWQNDAEESSQLDNLKRERRKLIETAAMKIPKLREVLQNWGSDLIHTLVYCTDKDPTQLEELNVFLKEKDYLYRQLTSLETSSKKDTQKILNMFRSGKIKILTAKRVLDEGVNIPETQTAFILASNTVERQWTQRRGRILRKCSSLGKTHATIHDFVVLPPALAANSDLDDADKKLINLELTRLIEFARLARNSVAADGAYSLINKLQSALGK